MVDNGQEFSGKGDDCNLITLLSPNSLEEFLQMLGASPGDHMGRFDESRSKVFGTALGDMAITGFSCRLIHCGCKARPADQLLWIAELVDISNLSDQNSTDSKTNPGILMRMARSDR